MRYEIQRRNITGSHLLSGGRGEDDHRRRWNVMDVTEYEDGDDDEWRNRQGIWKNVFR